MKILHVITGLQKAAGTSVFCGEVANGLAAMGYDMTVAVVNPDTHDLYALDKRINLTSISSILITNRLTTNNYDIIHIHGMWSPILHRVSNWAHRNKIPVVWSPHGMLTPWAMKYKWWKKMPTWWLYQRNDLKRASLIHVTAQSEVEDVRRIGLKNKIIIAPLGVDLIKNDNIKCIKKGGGGIILFVSRIQRKKGLENLLRAWYDLKMRTISYIGRVAPIKGLDSLCNAYAQVVAKDWQLVIIGPDQENHLAELQALAKQLNITDSVVFAGPKFGDDLSDAYANSDIFVLPSYSENFGSVVIEALAHSVPVITTKGTPWQELEENKCGWWIDIGVEPLVEALKEAMALSDEERREMGERGRKLVEEKYTWDAVCKAMVEGYEEVFEKFLHP